MSTPADDRQADDRQADDRPADDRPADDRIAVSIPATGYLRLRPSDGTPEHALVVIHGYGQPPTQLLDYAADVAPPATTLVAPEGPSAFYRRPRSSGGASAGGIGHGWIADPRRADAERRNDALIAAALDVARKRQPDLPPRVVLLAFSQGVGVATRFACSHPERVAGLVGLAGGVPAAWRDRLAALAGIPVLWVTGSRDHAYARDYNRAVVAALDAAGADLRAVELDADHGLLDDARDTVRAWLAERTRPTA